MDSVDPAFVATVVVGVQTVPSVVPMPTRTTLSISGSSDVNRTLVSPALATLNDRDVDPPAITWLEKNTVANVGVGVTTVGLSVQPAAPATVWLRIANAPAPTSPYVQLLTEDKLQWKRQWTDLLVGGYLGFGLLVFVVGLMHARLYGDRVFDVYCIYVACMLLFQLSFTGMGGLFLWRDWAIVNDAAP